jgi:hypothetical protein
VTRLRRGGSHLSLHLPTGKGLSGNLKMQPASSDVRDEAKHRKML